MIKKEWVNSQHSENWTEKEAMIGQMINQLGSKRHLNMSKRLWTKTPQVGAKNSTQKLSKTKAKLSQAVRLGKDLGKV